MPAFKPQINVPIEIALKYQGGKEVTSQIDGKPQVMYTLTSGEQLYLSPDVAQEIDALGVVPGEFFRLVKREIRNGVRRSTRLEFSLLNPDAQREHYIAQQSAPAQPTPGQSAPRTTPRAPAPPPPQPRAPQAAAQLMDQGPPVAWEDIPDHALEQQLAASVEQVQQRKAAPPAVSNVTAMPARNETSVRSAAAAPIVTNAFSLVAQVLGNALISAFDAAQTLEAYAASRGVAMRMDPEHIKCMAISIFIDLQRNGLARQAPQAPVRGPQPAVNGGATFHH